MFCLEELLVPKNTPGSWFSNCCAVLQLYWVGLHVVVCCVVFYGVMLCGFVLYGVVLCCVVLYGVMLWFCGVICYFVLCYGVV